LELEPPAEGLDAVGEPSDSRAAGGTGDPGFRRQPNLAQFWSHLRGPRYAVDFAGAAHLAFTDLVFLVPQLAGTDKAAAQARLQTLVGTMNPTAAYAAERAYVLAFFDQVLKGRGPVSARTSSVPGVRVTGH
jgi:hypothetical protein